MAWNRYRRGVAHAEQDDRNEARLDEVKIRLDFRLKKRVFNAVKKFTRDYRTAKRFLRTLVSGIDKANKTLAFGSWRQYNHGETIFKFEEEQSQMVAEMGEMAKVDGEVAKTLKRKQDRCARIQKVHSTMCQKTLQKWVMRIGGQSIEHAFKNWKQTVADLKHREGLLISLRK